MTDLTRELAELTRDECMALLATQRVGRVAVAVSDDGPLVVPVNFVVDADAIVFRSDLGSKVEAVRRGPISFQVDFVDWIHQTGWSVLARGPAYEATHWETNHLELEPWAGGDKRHWVRLLVRDISGRRLTLPEITWPNDTGYL